MRTAQEREMGLDVAANNALDEMPDEYVIRTFPIKNQAKSMSLTEYNEEKVLQKERQEGYE